MLEELGHEVILCTVVYDEKTPDTVWISEAAANGWILLTRDKAIRRRFIEICAVRDGRASLFVVVGNPNGAAQVEIIRKHVARIIRLFDQWEPPVLFSITESGVELRPHDCLPEPTRRSAVKRQPAVEAIE